MNIIKPTAIVHIKFITLLISLLFLSFNSHAQKNDSTLQIKGAIDSSEKLLHTAGVDLIRFSKQTSVGYSLNLLGTVIAVLGVSNQSNVSGEVNMLVPFGIFVASLGSVVSLLAPRHVGFAGNKLRRVKLRGK